MNNQHTNCDQKSGAEPSCRAFHLEETLQAVTDTFAAEVHAKGLSYSLKIDRKLPTKLAGDEGYLRRILLQMVGNAVKFTDEGGVTIEVRQDEIVDHWIKLHVNVIDTGCGLEKAELARMFDELPATVSEAGVTESRQLVARMGGLMGATSEQGWGSQFWFTLPLALTQFDSPAEDNHDERRILLVEDNKVNQRVALGMLSNLGYAGVAADNGEHALEILADGDFDLVFMDLQMPKLDGLAATRKIRSGAAGAENRHIPIIAMTAHASRQDRENCLSTGMNGYIAKPISSDRISEAIGKLAAAGTEGSLGGAPFSMEALVGLMNGDEDLAIEILELFQQDTQPRLQRLSSAAGTYDFATVSTEASAIEGSAVNLCSEIMVNLSRELSRAAGNKEQEYAASLIDEMALELAAMVQHV